MNKSMRRLLLAGAAVAVPATINAIIAYRAGQMTQPLPGEIGYYDWVYGCVAFYRMGQGSPLLLVHTPCAGASSWEWRNVFPALANHYTVYAIDLLGFGLSEKPNIPYTGRMYADLVHDFLQDVVGERADAFGSALSASYVVNAAVRRPDSLRRLVLINPTGTTRSHPSIVDGVTRSSLRSPVLGTSLYYNMVSMQNIVRELHEHLYYDTTIVTPELVNEIHAAAHQPGSRYAFAALLSGGLDLPMRMAFSALTQPTLLIWGRDAYYTPVDEASDLLYRHPEARLVVIDECGMLPHDEKAGEFLAIVRDFTASADMGEIAA